MVSIRIRRVVMAAFAALALAALPAAAQQGNRISITTGGTAGCTSRSAAAWLTSCRIRARPLGHCRSHGRIRRQPEAHQRRQVRGRFLDGRRELGRISGVDKFKDNKVNARTLMVLYPNSMHVVTIEGTSISKLSDLKGKRVSTGSPGSGTEIMALRVLEAVGIDGKKDLKQERLGAAESVNAIKDRKMDAFSLGRRRAHPGGHRPRGNARDEDEAGRSRRSGRRDEQEIRPAAREEHHLRRLVPGQDKAKRKSTSGTSSSSATRWATHGVHDRQDPVQKKATSSRCTRKRRTSSSRQSGGSPIPFHPGARKYFAEQGVKVN